MEVGVEATVRNRVSDAGAVIGTADKVAASVDNPDLFDAHTRYA